MLSFIATVWKLGFSIIVGVLVVGAWNVFGPSLLGAEAALSPLQMFHALLYQLFYIRFALCALLLAIPLCYLARARGWNRWWQWVLIGVAIAAVMSWVVSSLAILFGNAEQSPFTMWFEIFALAAPMAICASLIFWCIDARRNIRYQT